MCHETGSLLLVELLCNASADRPIRWDVRAVRSSNLEKSGQGVLDMATLWPMFVLTALLYSSYVAAAWARRHAVTAMGAMNEIF